MTAQKHTLQAFSREIVGRKVKQLRKEGKLPGHIYGKVGTNINVAVDTRTFLKVFSQVGSTGLVQLSVEGEESSRPVLISGVDMHPVSGAIMHIDFHQVNLKEKVTASIPVETIGESEAVKNGGVLVLPYNELEVTALPADLPESFTIDISKLLEVGNTVTIAELVYDKEKITISLDQDEVLASVQAQAAEEEPVAPESSEPVEVELTKQGATKAEEEPAAQ